MSTELIRVKMICEGVEMGFSNMPYMPFVGQQMNIKKTYEADDYVVEKVYLKNDQVVCEVYKVGRVNSNLKVQVRVAADALEYSLLNKEHIYRKLAIKMMNDLPLSDLEKLFRFKEIKPTSNEVNQQLFDLAISDEEKIELMSNKIAGIIIFEAILRHE